jgi:hypothetical protein
MVKRTQAKKRGGMVEGVSNAPTNAPTNADPKEPTTADPTMVAALDTFKVAVTVALGAKLTKEELKSAIDADESPAPLQSGGFRGGENIGWSLGGELPAEMVGGSHHVNTNQSNKKSKKRGGQLSYSLLGGRRRTGRKTGKKH